MDLSGYLDKYKWFNKIERIVNNTRMYWRSATTATTRGSMYGSPKKRRMN